MLVNEQDIVLEAGVHVWLEAEMYDDRVVMTVDMRIDTVQSLENLSQETREGLWERYTCKYINISAIVVNKAENGNAYRFG